MTVKGTKLEMVTYYLIKTLRTRLTKTKLMKLLFISDYIAKEGKNLGIGRTITGTKYIYYHYGPFSFDVYPIINKMNNYEILELDSSEKSRYGSLFSYDIGPRPRFEIKLNDDEKKILNFVIDKYGFMSLDTLLTLVYNSKPMKNAQVNDIILEWDYE